MGDICAALEMLHSLAHQNVSLATNVVNVLLGSSSILNTAVTFSRADRPLSQVGQSTAYSSTRLLMWLVERIVHSGVGFFGGIGHKFLIIVCVTFDYVVSAGSNTVNVWIYGHQTESELLVTGLSRQPPLSLSLYVCLCVWYEIFGVARTWPYDLWTVNAGGIGIVLPPTFYGSVGFIYIVRFWSVIWHDVQTVRYRPCMMSPSSERLTV